MPEGMTANELKTIMPLLARHEGVWDGTYSYFNADNEKIDEHASRLICRFPDDGPVPYHQTNHYTSPDGKKEIREFPAEYRDKLAEIMQSVERDIRVIEVDESGGPAWPVPVPQPLGAPPPEADVEPREVRESHRDRSGIRVDRTEPDGRPGAGQPLFELAIQGVPFYALDLEL